MAVNYANIAKADQKDIQGGYKNVVFFAPISSFLTFGTPVDPPVALGDEVTISTAHTFGASDGFYSWLCKKHTVTSTTETTGDPGAQSLVHHAKFTLLGDSASTLEQLRNLLNDDSIFLVKDQDCVNGQYVQFGDECLAPNVKVSFDGKTTAEGLKEYTVELDVKDKKFFYNAAVTQHP